MSLKMATLVKESGISKSTILYYVKEGLLPSPQKPKPNVHLYDEECISILNFIKYLQENLNYSITEIKSIITDNKIDFKNDTQTVITYLSAMSGKNREEEILDIKNRARKFGVDETLFIEYEKTARKLASLEYEMGAKILIENGQNDKNILQKTIFDIILTLKPYIFNKATIKEHQARVYNNTKELS